MPAMADRTATGLLRNAARGNQSYKASRLKIARAILASPADSIVDLNSFLLGRLFKLKEDWTVLGFGSGDWPILDAISQKKNTAAAAPYERLLIAYVIANADRVKNLYEASEKISGGVMADDGVMVSEIYRGFDSIDRQSLFAFRIFAAQRSYSSEGLVNYCKEQMTTDWLRKRFLYPFVYYSINNSPDLNLESFLSYIVSSDALESEVPVLKFLLCDEIDTSSPAAFKYYIGLLCHPYDACEVFLNHAEIEFAEKGHLSAEATESLRALAESVPVPRVMALQSLVQRSPFHFVSAPTELARSL